MITLTLTGSLRRAYSEKVRATILALILQLDGTASEDRDLILKYGELKTPEGSRLDSICYVISPEGADTRVCVEVIANGKDRLNEAIEKFSNCSIDAICDYKYVVIMRPIREILLYEIGDTVNIQITLSKVDYEHRIYVYTVQIGTSS